MKRQDGPRAGPFSCHPPAASFVYEGTEVMMMRKLIAGSLLAATLGGLALAAQARTSVDFYVNFAPPPAYYEPVPAPRPGFVWVPGYWDWRAARYHWVTGHWVRARPSYVYSAPRYYQSGGRWYATHGGWRRGDADGDGVPNRYDRYPGNPWYR